MKTTLNQIRAHGPCGMDPRAIPLTGFCKLRASLGDSFDPDAPVSILTILDSNGLDDALWCLRAVEGHDKEIRLYVVWCARQVQHLMTDKRSETALDVAERFASGMATRDELERAWAAAGWDTARYAALAAALAAARAAACGTAAGWAAARDAQEKELRRICAEIESAS